MISRITAITIILIGITNSLTAQQSLKGKIYDINKVKTLPSASIRNITQKVFQQSDFNGNYKIAAADGDSVIISSVSYLPDTVLVIPSMLDNAHDISLKQSPEVLQSVTVGQYNNYQLDSLTRREEYDKIYKRKNAKLFGGETPGGVGITMSPISYFSGKERKQRNQVDQLSFNEQQYYIDYRFAPTYVNRLTGLQGDSLHNFMIRYRPTYAVARKSSQQDILFYINDKLIEFKKGVVPKPGK